MTRLHLIALPIATALLLSACSGSNDSEHAATAQNRSSSAGLPKGRVEQGEALAHTKGEATGQSCIDCHGPDGNEPLDPTYPKLGGQYADYLAHALMAYRAGERSNALMANQASGLNDQEIADLAAYFGSRPSQIVTLEAAHSQR
ncbi:c-type cytochrome [Luteimonas sp. MHLX1A]|uniref:c-type cytochrome n=1 Tax=Alterluteimonas muca TaxID=2878684 RepID=UPI001E5A2E74|nr:cytochrome c [Luteimonas sp. MHLX1A]MCD9045655.1 cytochrome c [Luteimonas sp. MHLX1A]